MCAASGPAASIERVGVLCVYVRVLVVSGQAHVCAPSFAEVGATGGGEEAAEQKGGRAKQKGG